MKTSMTSFMEVRISYCFPGIFCCLECFGPGKNQPARQLRAPVYPKRALRALLQHGEGVVKEYVKKIMSGLSGPYET